MLLVALVEIAGRDPDSFRQCCLRDGSFSYIMRRVLYAVSFLVTGSNAFAPRASSFTPASEYSATQRIMKGKHACVEYSSLPALATNFMNGMRERAGPVTPPARYGGGRCDL